MSVSRIFLSDDQEEVYDHDEKDFYQTEVVQIRARTLEEAREIAEHVADKFGSEVDNQ